MGLDMNLRKEIFVGAEYESRGVEIDIDLKIGDKVVDIPTDKVHAIMLSVGYWRKANAIHSWFVENVQDGNDDCGSHYVPYVKLLDLKDLCQEALDHPEMAEYLLPNSSGYFTLKSGLNASTFGSTEYDEYYERDLKNTIEIIENLDNGMYIYRSSW